MKQVILMIIIFAALMGLLEGTIVNTNITSSVTWTLAGSPYIIATNVTIYGASSPVVTIDPGVVVKFNAGYSLSIGHSSSSSNPGGMVVNGTAENPVLFTANSDTPAPGFWANIRSNVYSLPDNVVFHHAVFEYGGSSNGLFDVYGGNPQFYDCTFRYSFSAGLYHTSTSTSASIQKCSFAHNTTYPIVWNPCFTPLIGSGNTYTDNNPNRILLKEVTLTAGSTWADKGIPYEPVGNITLHNLADPLVVESGVNVQFRYGKSMFIGSTSSTSLAGSLLATRATFTAVDTENGWNGLDFQSYTQPSELNNCLISEVQSSAVAAIYLRCNNLARISGSTVTLNDTYGVYANTGAVFTLGTTTLSNNATTVNIHVADVFRLGSGNSYLNNTNNRIYCRGGSITVSTSWTRQPTTLFIAANTTFSGADAPVMVIPYGTVLDFAAGINLAVGSTTSPSLTGILRATGVTFKGAEASSGYWTGLIFNNYGGNSVLSGCIVRDAGFGSAPGIRCNCVHGTITGSTIYNCADDGIYMAANCLVSLSGNVIFGCGAYPLSIGANSLRILGENNYFTGNANDRIEVRAENIDSSGTWRNAGVPYYITGNFSIYGGSFPHLKLMPDVVIMLPDAVAINIGSSSSASLKGSLEADGATFTRSAADVIPQGLVFQTYIVNEQSILSHCTFEYLRHSTQNCAVYVYSSSPTFEGCTFRNNLGGGIAGNSAARPVVNNCSFLDNGGYPIKTNASAFDVVSGVGNFFAGNSPDRILISGGNINANMVWDNPSVPVEVSGNITVYGSAAPILQINSGLMLLFNNSTGISIGSSTSPSLTGGIQAEGATFSALSGLAGGWDGMTLNPYLAAGSWLRNCIFQFAGGMGNLYLYNSPLATIESCIFRWGTYGIRLNGANAHPGIIRNYIQSNERGIYCFNNANPLIGGTLADGNSLANNTVYGIQNTSSLTLNAEYNWWGDAAGPTLRIGDYVSSNVDFTPWRTTNIGDAPARFHLLSPAQATVLNTIAPVLDWQEAIDPSPGDVVTYTLQLCPSTGFTSGVITYAGLVATVFHIPEGVLNDDSPYYWRVSATDTQAQTTTSYEAYLMFSIAVPEPPADFSPLAPAQDATVPLTSPLLQWQPAIDPDPGDVVHYVVYKDITAEFAAPDSITTEQSSAWSAFCQPGTLYYWKVKATDSTGLSTFSPLVRFFTDINACPRAPVDFTLSIAGNDLQLSWDAVPGADNYYVYFADTPTGTFNLLGSSVSPAYQHLGAALEPRGFYQVIAEDVSRRK